MTSPTVKDPPEPDWTERDQIVVWDFEGCVICGESRYSPNFEFNHLVDGVELGCFHDRVTYQELKNECTLFTAFGETVIK